MLTTKDAQTLRFDLMAREYVQRIGGRLRRRREALGLSQREVADRMPGPVTGNDISRWERGEHKPGDERLEKLAEILQTTVAALLTDPPDQSVTPDLSFDGSPELDQLRAEISSMRQDLGTALAALTDMRKMLAQRLGTQAPTRQSRRAK